MKSCNHSGPHSREAKVLLQPTIRIYLRCAQNSLRKYAASLGFGLVSMFLSRTLFNSVFSLSFACAVEKGTSLQDGRRISHPATVAPAGSNRSAREWATTAGEAFGGEGR